MQKCAFVYSVDYIYYLEPIETNAIQMHNSVIVHGISEFRFLNPWLEFWNVIKLASSIFSF